MLRSSADDERNSRFMDFFLKFYSGTLIFSFISFFIFSRKERRISEQNPNSLIRRMLILKKMRFLLVFALSHSMLEIKEMLGLEEFELGDVVIEESIVEIFKLVLFVQVV